MEREGEKLICPHCKHEWETNSKLKLVTCSSCGLKIPNPNFKEEEKF